MVCGSFSNHTCLIQKMTIIFFFFTFLDSSTKEFIDRTCSGKIFKYGNISFYAPLQIKNTKDFYSPISNHI